MGRRGFHFENLLEEIDLPGEYFIDRTAGILYLLPNTAFQATAPVITLTALEETFIEMNSVTSTAMSLSGPDASTRPAPLES